MSCGGNCKNSRFELSPRVNEARRLYAPLTSSILKNGGKTCKNSPCAPSSLNSCFKNCSSRNLCGDKVQKYWSRNSDVSCLCAYETQPWYRDPVVEEEWGDFTSGLVTPENVDCFIRPGKDEYQYKCHKVRSMLSPCVTCTWDLPEQDQCATLRYGYNRDWRRYNEDQRMMATGFKCGGEGASVCPDKNCEWPPYLGKKYGGRYMSWAHPKSLMFPKTQPFHWQSIPSC